MKKYTKVEIDKKRNDFRENGFEEIEAYIGGLTFRYFILPQSIEANLPDFVFRCTGDPSDGYVFGVSDSVRRDFMPYVVAHEFFEFVKIGMNEPNRCVLALERELELVSKDKRKDYIEMRRNFFRNLVDYSKDREETDVEDLNEYKKSLARLEQLIV